MLIFLNKFLKKGYFQSKPEKMNITTELFIFQLKLTIFILWTKFAQKGYFRSKKEKVNITIEFCTFELVFVPNFRLN